MKIVIYSQVYFPVLGGLQRNTYTLATILTQQGHDVVVITETSSSEQDTEEFRVFRIHSVGSLIKIIRAGELLIVNGGLSLKACLIAKIVGKKYIIIYQSAEGFLVNSGLKKRVLSPIRKRLAKAAAINIVQTEFASAIFHKHSLQVAVLQNPVDPQLMKVYNKTKAKEYDFLFAGRVIDGKGIFVLIEALQNLRRQGRNPSLAIAGSGDAMERVKTEAEGLSVTFLGNIDKAELATAYQAAKILVVPTSGHMEGSPLVISEAISLGVPVICSDQPAMIEAAGSAGISFRSGNVKDLTSLLAQVLMDETFYTNLAISTTREAVKFSPDQYADRMESIIKTATS